jgi:threonyl-tRNA synthetase
VAVLNVSEKSDAYARQVVEQCRAAGLRVEADLSGDKIGAKIRLASINKVPYMLVIGEKEAADGKVAVRHRTEGDKGTVPAAEFIEQVRAAVSSRQ